MPLQGEIPFNTNNPAVREYLTLVRLQVLTPLSLLISIATFLAATFIVSPGTGTISKLHPTPVSPSPPFVGIYVLVVFFAQIGYCVLLTLASKEETKKTLIKGAGFALVTANWVLTFWVIAWAFQWFVLSTVLLAILTLVLLHSNIVLLIYHTPERSRPFDTLFIHTPMRLFLLLSATLLLPQSIFIMVGKTWDPKQPAGHYNDYQWEGFAAVLVTNAVALLIIVLRLDVIWCIGAIWINICIWSERPKSTAVQATTIVFTVLLPVTLLAMTVWQAFSSGRRREGVIALPPDDERIEPNQQTNTHDQNVERVWR